MDLLPIYRLWPLPVNEFVFGKRPFLGDGRKKEKPSCCWQESERLLERAALRKIGVFAKWVVLTYLQPAKRLILPSTSLNLIFGYSSNQPEMEIRFDEHHNKSKNSTWDGPGRDNRAFWGCTNKR
jgi:hypothetical protein